MRRFLETSWRKLFSFTAKKIAAGYIRKDRHHSYKNFSLLVYKDVFHPGLFRSTKVFARWLEGMPLENKEVLELGCGTGLLSLVAAGKKAIVTAIDINPRAVANAAANAEKNHLQVITLHSDLFAALAGKKFDMVLINPPFYAKDPASDYEHAWYCGANFSYFEKLFGQLAQRPAEEICYMILSDTCDITSIRRIGQSFRFEEVHREKVSGELFFIYRLQKVRG